jgi:glycosyltransferase involved in cell wall biosynthesis
MMNATQPRFSVITACYNSEKTIENTIISMINQTFNDYEYIIIDGGSKDGTLEIIEKHKPKFNDKITVISEKDDGIYDAMNKGLGLAKGHLIGILNSDDWFENNTLELVKNRYSGNKYEVVYGMQRNLENEKVHSVFIKSHEFLPEHMITHPTCFVTKETYDELGVFNKKYRSSADYELMLRFYYAKKVVFSPIYEVLSNFRMGGMSSGQIGTRENAEIKLNLGIISKKTYVFLTLKSKIYEFFSNLNK